MAGFNSPTCVYCDEDCIDCQDDGEGNAVCHLCDDHTNGDAQFGYKDKCVKNCPSSLFTGTFVCESCEVGCENCNSGVDCIEERCLPNYKWEMDTAGFEGTGNCVLLCDSQFFWNPDTEACSPCRDNCAECGISDIDSFMNVCYTCLPGFKETPDGRCVEKCSTYGFYEQDGECV